MVNFLTLNEKIKKNLGSGNTNRLRNIELPENLFSNLGESKKNKNIQPTIQTTIRPSEKNKDEDILKKYNIDNDLKLTNYSNKKEYRDRGFQSSTMNIAETIFIEVQLF